MLWAADLIPWNTPMLVVADSIPGNTPHAGCGRPHLREHTPCWVRQTPFLGIHPMLGAADPIPENTPMLVAVDPTPGNTPHAGCGISNPWDHTPCWVRQTPSLGTHPMLSAADQIPPMLGAADPIPGNTPMLGAADPIPGNTPMLGAADPIPGNTPHAWCDRPHRGTYPMLGAADPIPGNTLHAWCDRPHRGTYPIMGAADPIPGNMYSPCWVGQSPSLEIHPISGNTPHGYSRPNPCEHISCCDRPN